jgi:tRNA (guanosine-2'-O-)-methyltransferase
MQMTRIRKNIVNNAADSPRSARIRNIKSRRLPGIILVMEDIHDPYNAMATTRSADAFGVGEVHFIFENEKPFNPEQVGKKTSASASKWLAFTTWAKTADCLNKLKQDGYKILVTALTPASVSLADADLARGKIALVFGNEKTGVSPEAISLADAVIRIPMYGFVQSLNLSVSVGVVLYELNRQRR